MPARSLIQNYLNEKSANQKTSTNLEFIVGDDILDNNNTRNVYVQQQYEGLDLQGAVLGVFVTKDERTLSNDDLAHEVQVNATTPILSAEQAVRAAMDALGGFPLVASLEVKETSSEPDQKTTFAKGNIAAGDFKTRLVYVPTSFKSSKYKLAWETQAYTLDRHNYWLAYIDAQTGDLIKHQDLVLHCSFGGLEYDHSHAEAEEHSHHEHLMHLEAAQDMAAAIEAANQEVAVPDADSPFAFAEAAMMGTDHTFLVLPLPADSPYNAGQSVGKVSDGDATASPYGWTSTDGAAETNNTKGNNVYAFYDPSPGPLGGAPASVTPPTTVGGTGPSDWNYPWDLTQEPEYMDGASFPNRDAAIVNLFYQNNMIHDVFYGFGFDEKGRNFQNTNVFNGENRGSTEGVGGDEVLAQAQDGGGTNNANMLTLADGTNGQMQMYLWTAATADDLVKINPNSFDADYVAGTRYNALQGSFANAPTADVNLWTNPVLDKEYVIINDPNDLSCPGIAGVNSQGSTACGTGAPMAGVGLPPCNDISDKIVIIDRGDCSFVEKVNGAELNANGRPAGIIIVNNAPGGSVIGMGGTDATANTVQTPAVMISFEDGQELKAAVNAATAAGQTITGSLERTFAPPPKRDGDFDNGVIGHEYGHGISTRSSIRTAGGLGNLSGAEQGGEGWSDFWGLYLTLRSGDLEPATSEHPNGTLPTRGIGNYVTYRDPNGPGIRPRPYSIDFAINEYTFAGTASDRLGVGDVNPDSPHGVGFIWCTMLYEVLQEFVDEYGINDDIFNNGSDLTTAGGNNILNRLLIRGIQLQNASTFTGQRDAILLADEELYNGQHKCMIWNAFAKRGLGVNAAGSDTALGGEVDDFSVPTDCGGLGAAVLELTVDAPTNAPQGSDVIFTYTARNKSANFAPGVQLEVTLPANYGNIVPADGGSASGNVVTWSLGNLNGNESKVVSLTASITGPEFTDDFFFDDMENGTSMWTTVDGGLPADVWSVRTSAPSTGMNSWFVPDPNNSSEQMLQTANPITVPNSGSGVVANNIELVFYHQYTTEAGFDAGILEYASTPGGPWTDMESLITQNGYTDNIPLGNNPTLRPTGGDAFGGSSNGYVQTRADLNSLAGQDIYLRWRFSADVATPGTGWWIDNVVVGNNVTYVSAEANLTGSGTVNDALSTELLITASALPVDLVTFEASAREKDILLGWVTATEINNSGFHIERRAENETSFRKIGWEDGAGDSDEEIFYNYVDTDIEPGITYYYRLQQEDFDGQFEYSEIRKARLTGRDDMVNLSPNPTSGQVQITWSTPVGSYDVEVFDAAGKSVRFRSANDAAYLDLDLSDLAEQIYLVRITTNNEVITKRVVLSK